ncbi:GGDEF domain-containing protein [Desulforamulus ferrireducens]|nr:diguanylate cyclase [Desulforamulus ferrireducens]
MIELFIIFMFSIQIYLNAHGIDKVYGLETLDLVFSANCVVYSFIVFVPTIFYFILQINRINEMEQELCLDSMTGLYNKSYLLRAALLEVERNKRYAQPFSIIFIDLDNFKEINDTYGHKMGDSVIVKVAEKIKKTVRTIDVPVRYGGDEFVILMPQTTYEGAKSLLVRLQEKVSLIDIPCKFKLDISGGISTFPNDSKDLEQLFDLADKRMYKNKEIKRNKQRPLEQSKYLTV